MEIIRYRYGWFFLMFCVIHFAYACSQEINRQMVIGFYLPNHELVEDTLEIKADGRYVHKYKINKSGEFVNTGTWVLEEWDGEQIITFEGWTPSRASGIKLEVMGKKIEVGTQRGRWPAHVERTIFGQVRLPIDRDRGYYYLKER